MSPHGDSISKQYESLGLNLFHFFERQQSIWCVSYYVTSCLHEPCWPDMGHIDQIWAMLTRYGPFWSYMDHVDHIWTMLNRYGPCWPKTIWTDVCLICRPSLPRFPLIMKDKEGVLPYNLTRLSLVSTSIMTYPPRSTILPSLSTVTSAPTLQHQSHPLICGGSHFTVTVWVPPLKSSFQIFLSGSIVPWWPQPASLSLHPETRIGRCFSYLHSETE